MDQAPGLTMSDRTAPPSRVPTPRPADAAADAPASTSAAGAALGADSGVDSGADSGASASAAAAPSSPQPRTSSDTITEATHKIAQHGLYQGSLEEEVGQVMGTLGSFWGGLKKQSASAFKTIKQEADRTVLQVQEDFKYLQTAKVEVVRKDAATWEAEQAAEREKKDKGKGRADGGGEGGDAAGADPGAVLPPLPPLPESATALLSRLTESTSQLQQTLQGSLTTTLAAARANPALAEAGALRAQLAENLRLSAARANLQLSLQQAERVAEEALKRGGAGLQQAEKLAEGYLRLGEGWVKDAEKWVGDNVRVVPPAEGEGADAAAGATQYVSVGWDGADFYSFSTSTAAADGGGDGVLFDARAGAGAGAGAPGRRVAASALAGSRKETLLRQLREDKALLLVDPAGAGESDARRAQFSAWVEAAYAPAYAAEREQEEGHVGAVRMALVPESLTDEQFWQRYLFHKHMLEAEEVRRKALLQATEDQADDFSWDDDEDGAAPATARDTPTSATPVTAAAETAPAAPAASAVPTPAHAAATPAAPAQAAKDSVKSAGTSPRDSEESYDLVSDQGRKGAAPAPAAAAAAAPAASADEDEDSDWE